MSGRSPVEDGRSTSQKGNNRGHDGATTTTPSIDEVREGLQSSLSGAALRGIANKYSESERANPATRLAMNPQLSKGLGQRQQIREEPKELSVAASIQDVNDPSHSGLTLEQIAKQDFGIELNQNAEQLTLSLHKSNTKIELTAATEKVGVSRSDSTHAQVNVVDKMGKGIVSVDRISVDKQGEFEQISTMKINIGGANPEQTLNELQQLGITLESEIARIKVLDDSGGKAISISDTTAELTVSFDRKSGVVTIESRNLAGVHGGEINAGAGMRVAQSLQIDTKGGNAITGGDEYHVDQNGNRVGERNTPGVHSTTSARVRRDAVANAGALDRLEPGEVFTSGVGIDWQKDVQGKLYYNTNSNRAWGRLDREETYTPGENGEMKAIVQQQGFAEGMLEAMERGGEKPVVKAYNLDLDVHAPADVAKVFNHGFDAAQKFANQNGYALGYKPSGVFEKSIGGSAPINVASMKPLSNLQRIELQEIWAQKMTNGQAVGEPMKLGFVRIQDKTHLRGPIASPEKISNDIYSLMEKKLGL